MPAPSGQIPPPWAWWENEAPALAETSEAQEQAAIDTGQIRAGGIRYAATRP